MPWVSARVVGVYKAFDNIGWINAGPDQNVLCAATVQLEATVQGDINQHIFEWEQLSGTAVTLNDANTLTPWFTNPLTTEIIFRFWVDRGTAYEKFDDVYIGRDPSEFPGSIVCQVPQSDNTESYPISASIASAPATSGMMVQPTNRLFYYWDFNDGEITARPPNTQLWVHPSQYADQVGTRAAEVTTSGSALMWSDPASTTFGSLNYIGVTIQKFNTTTKVWDWQADIAVGGNTYYNIVEGSKYRLIARWERTTTTTRLTTKRVKLESFLLDTVFTASAWSQADLMRSVQEPGVVVQPYYAQQAILSSPVIRKNYRKITLNESYSAGTAVIANDMAIVLNNVTRFGAIEYFDSEIVATAPPPPMLQNMMVTTIARSSGISIG